LNHLQPDGFDEEGIIHFRDAARRKTQSRTIRQGACERSLVPGGIEAVIEGVMVEGLGSAFARERRARGSSGGRDGVEHERLHSKMREGYVEY
jgi:hypothetical protein